jgi:hypothetical protein
MTLPLAGRLALSNGKIAEGTNATTIQTAAATDYAINEQLYSKAITDNIALTACAVQAIGTTAMYSLFMNAAGTVTTVKGTEQKTGTKQPLSWGVQPADTVMFGAIKVVNATNTFTAGTTDLSASGVTATYYNVMAQPSFTLQA